MNQGFTWHDYLPQGSGSFGRSDMGAFCEVDGILFVVPFTDVAVNNLDKIKIETLIKQILETKPTAKTYELNDTEFTERISNDWHSQIQKINLNCFKLAIV